MRAANSWSDVSCRRRAAAAGDDGCCGVAAPCPASSSNSSLRLMRSKRASARRARPLEAPPSASTRAGRLPSASSDATTSSPAPVPWALAAASSTSSHARATAAAHGPRTLNGTVCGTRARGRIAGGLGPAGCRAAFLNPARGSRPRPRAAPCVGVGAAPRPPLPPRAPRCCPRLLPRCGLRLPPLELEPDGCAAAGAAGLVPAHRLAAGAAAAARVSRAVPLAVRGLFPLPPCEQPASSAVAVTPAIAAAAAACGGGCASSAALPSNARSSLSGDKGRKAAVMPLFTFS